MTDESTNRQWAEGTSPLCEVREYPMGEHTPGPWKYQITWSDGDEDVVRHASIGKIAPWGGLHIATISSEVPNDQRLANARLIAAAPDLLEALEACREYFDDRADAETIYDQGDVGSEEMLMFQMVDEAIAKARSRG